MGRRSTFVVGALMAVTVEGECIIIAPGGGHLDEGEEIWLQLRRDFQVV
jgi:hypothetical protein